MSKPKTESEWYNAAFMRVYLTQPEELRIYEYVLLEYDWNTEGHFKWVATSPLKEILSWCNTVLQYKEE
jgi:hypothetical protein